LCSQFPRRNADENYFKYVRHNLKVLHTILFPSIKVNTLVISKLSARTWPIITQNFTRLSLSGPLVVAVKQKAKCTFNLIAILLLNIFYACISVCLSFSMYVPLSLISLCLCTGPFICPPVYLPTRQRWSSYLRLLKMMYRLYWLFFAQWHEEMLMFFEIESGNCRIIFPTTIPAFRWRRWETLQKCHSG
jgi:hypothetical protein